MAKTPFKMKGFSGFGNSPMTKKSPAKTEGHGGAEDHTHETEKTEESEPSEEMISRYYYAGTEGFTSPEEGGLQPLSDEEKSKVEAYINKPKK